MPQFTLAQLAEMTEGRLSGDGARIVTGARPPQAAGDGDVTFVFQAKALRELADSAAGAVVLAEGLSAPGRDAILHRNPPLAMATILAAFHPQVRPAPGVHAWAVVDPSARLGVRVHVGAFAVVGAGAEIGDDAVIGAQSYVGEGCVVGAETRIFPQVALYPGTTLGRRCVLHAGVVVGADGFGFARDRTGHVKIPQVGGVVIGDDVEIGANSCVDRGTMTPTRIGSNTKIDNLVQVGHNCEIGERVIVCGQSALAGTTKIEDDCVLAGQVGTAGHLTIGRGAMIAAGSGVTSDVDPGAKMAGHPPMRLEDWRRAHAVLRHLPEMREELRALRKRVEELERPS